jgi:hypothetical protein
VWGLAACLSTVVIPGPPRMDISSQSKQPRGPYHDLLLPQASRPCSNNFVIYHHWIFFFLTFSPKTEQKTRSGKRRRTRERRGENAVPGWGDHLVQGEKLPDFKGNLQIYNRQVRSGKTPSPHNFFDPPLIPLNSKYFPSITCTGRILVHPWEQKPKKEPLSCS